MSENESSNLTMVEQPGQTNPGKIPRVLLKPRKTMPEIVNTEKAIWLFPLLILMVSSLILTMITASIEKRTAVPAEMPPDMEYYPEEYQDQYSNVMAQNSGFVRTTLFPIIGRWLGIWSNWLILSVILMVLLLLAGHPLEWRGVFNLAAWSALPFVVRDVVQSVYLLAAGQLITSPGLSGFGPVDAQGLAGFFAVLLKFIDLYLVWQLLLILAGFRPVTQIKLLKGLLILLGTAVLYLSIRSLPAFIINRISSVFTNGMFYF